MVHVTDKYVFNLLENLTNTTDTLQELGMLYCPGAVR